ncbi:Acylphosphatase [Sphingobium chlorophenolicum L-1]|uniref:acylphosphatase n=1 Tax=Sphingobium chlorophenolicum L-1 TaxID=690566 RepID=F6EZB4_SPHCR|nr:acylphosphatase [Sphingobium chlorophenolicum]AEG48390.1 Acylphosphatase [Sphingobium chlorophenolicum L-1]
MAVIARHLTILGRVQGVFYRNWALERANSLGLAGWVRNRMDGSVEAMVEGAEQAVGQFISLAHEGPPAAHVTRIDVAVVDVEGLASFQKRPTC